MVDVELEIQLNPPQLSITLTRLCFTYKICIYKEAVEIDKYTTKDNKNELLDSYNLSWEEFIEMVDEYLEDINEDYGESPGGYV